ncbi:GumC family protein [Sulfurimonas diazotrophicus]|uniref:non-specific protein-tyrosine kinase n=1 Tax=Sulfurimonas diazotrophicus TaxID=3131939 RepID=A0ABZ3H7M2_9BACT
MTTIEDDEIDLKALFATIWRRKIAVMTFTVVIAFVAAIFAYITPNVYRVSTMIEVQEESNKFGSGLGNMDIMSQAFGISGVNLDNEQLVIKSRFLLQKALGYLDIGTRYFTNKHFRETELYKNSPFIVTTTFIDEDAYGARIKLIPIDQERFELKIDPPSMLNPRVILRKIGLLPSPEHAPVIYEGTHRYGELISSPWFKLKVNRITELTEDEYSFSVTPNQEMWEMLQENLTTSLASKMGSIMIISYEDNVPLRAQEIANAVTRAYLDQEIESKTAEADHTLAFIDDQLNAINKALQSSQKNLERFKQSNIVVDISQKASITTDKLSEYESKLQELDIQESVLANLQQYMLNNADISGIALGSAGFANQDLVAMISDLKEKMVERKTLLVEYTELHPDVVKLSESISSMRKSILFTIDSSLKVIQQQKDALTKIVNDYKRSLEALPGQEQKLVNLTRTTMVNEKIYSFLLEKRAETAILRSSTVSKTRIIDSALLPKSDEQVKPKRALIAVVGLILGFILGIFYAFVREFLDNTVKSQEDIQRLTHIPVYGMIPTVKGKKFNSIFYEAFRALRTNLEFMRSDKAHKTVVVTSTVSGEGKTTVSANLATIYAKSGKKVVVLDLDMRRAKLSEYFDLRNDKGLSTLLSHRHNLDEIIQHSEQDGVDVIAAGPVPPNPSELIMSDYAKEMMQTLRERYDYIILDTPPVGLVTDAAILMHQADVSLLVTRYGYSKKEFVRGLDRLVQEHKIDHVGIIFNGVDIEKNYGYGYGYGYKYGGDKYYT